MQTNNMQGHDKQCYSMQAPEVHCAHQIEWILYPRGKTQLQAAAFESDKAFCLAWRYPIHWDASLT